MNKTERITKKINANKDVLKGINEVSFFGIEEFIYQANRYLKAIEEGRMINCIGKVSASGMSRTIKFLECKKNSPKSHKKYGYLNFWALFKSLGYNPDRDGYSRIYGCGMDMIFNTNYTIVRRLKRLGFISAKKCEILEQETPQTI